MIENKHLNTLVNAATGILEAWCLQIHAGNFTMIFNIERVIKVIQGYRTLKVTSWIPWGCQQQGKASAKWAKEVNLNLHFMLLLVISCSLFSKFRTIHCMKWKNVEGVQHMSLRVQLPYLLLLLLPVIFFRNHFLLKMKLRKNNLPISSATPSGILLPRRFLFIYFDVFHLHGIIS